MEQEQNQLRHLKITSLEKKILNNYREAVENLLNEPELLQAEDEILVGVTETSREE